MNVSIIKRVIKNEYINTIVTRGFTLLLGILLSSIMARYLGSELKGINSYITSITSIGSIVITFGMHQAYPYFRKTYGKEKIYNDYVSLVMVIFAVYFVVSLIVCCFLPTAELKVASFVIPLVGYANVVSYVCLVENPNRRNKWWTIISVAELLYLICLKLFTNRNFYWGVSIIIFADLLKDIVYTVSLGVKPRLHRGLYKLLKEIYKIGFLPMVALLMTTLNYRIDVLMLRSYSYITDSMIGIYSIGIFLVNKIVMIPDTLKGVMVSKLAKGASEHEVAKVARLTFWVTVLVCFMFIVMGEWGINVLYGDEYEGAYTVTLISAAGTLFIGYFKLIAQYNIVNRKQIRNLILLSIAIVVNVILNRILIPVYGINGAAVATGVGHFVCGIAFMVWFSRKTSIHITEMIFIQKHDLQVIKKFMKKSGIKASSS